MKHCMHFSHPFTAGKKNVVKRSHVLFCLPLTLNFLLWRSRDRRRPPPPLSRHTFVSLVSRLISSWFWESSLYLSSPPRSLEQIKASRIWASGLKLPLERLELPLSLSPATLSVVSNGSTAFPHADTLTHCLCFPFVFPHLILGPQPQ